MDVFMSNLPEDLTDKTLRKALKPHLNSLHIRDWGCQKPRKKKFGNVSFLRAHEGLRFLEVYGEQMIPGVLTAAGQPKMKARLRIFNMFVYCKPSSRALDPFLLRSLEKEAADRLLEPEPEEAGEEDTRVVFKATSLSCGFYSYGSHDMYPRPDGDELIYTPEVKWGLLSALAKFDRNSVSITFTGTAYKDQVETRVEIPYRTIEGVVISSQTRTLTLTLWEVPRFYEMTDSMTSLMQGMSITRQTANAPTRTRLTELAGGSKSHREVVGQALVYQITVDPVDFHTKSTKLCERASFDVSMFNFREGYSNMSLSQGLVRLKEVAQQASTMGLPFAVLFQLQALANNAYLLPWTVEHVLKMLMRAFKSGKKHLPISALAIKKLFSQIPFPSPSQPATMFAPMEIWDLLLKNEAEVQQGLIGSLFTEREQQSLTMVYKANVTPTGMVMHGPEAEAKNRILRRFPDHIDFFIRVQFYDEDGRDIFFNTKVSHDRIFDRFRSVFNNGISIVGRVYSFLGFSHSSLRSHSAWFMAPFYHQGTLQTYETVIQALGRFSSIYSPARCAARIGQAFSETPFAVNLEENKIKYHSMPDVTSADGSRVFSDGVGRISQGVVDLIQASMPRRKAEPTCFQIRWAGAKGMLALDPNLKGLAMVTRPSMVKFESTDTANLEICDMASNPIPMVLNRQMIKILEDMAVPDDWFLSQQHRELKRLRLITAQTDNTVAFLARHKIADCIGFPQFLRRLGDIGIDYKTDAFLCSVVESIVLRELRLLKHKARIPIAKGVTLFGIMDETGFLGENEIYITFDKAAFIHDHYLNLDGLEMIVTRSPALHPGDIQLANNVVPPSDHPLARLKNCVVFSTKGERDLPSQLSGGDLDGDIYNMIWDQEAVARCRYLHTPADYPRVEPVNIGRPVEKSDMTDFFVQFMATDQLGLIAVKHMILADQRPAGTVDQDCKLLAEMHSTGVDYSKTGVAVDMSKLRTIKFNKFRPDFLSPAPPTNLRNATDIAFDEPKAQEDDDDGDVTVPKHQYYRSEKILGKLYRAVDEKKIWNEDIMVARGKSKVWSLLLAHIDRVCKEKLGPIDWSAAKKEAWHIRRFYEDGILNATVDFSEHAAMGIKEIEVFTGTIHNKSGVQTRRQRDRSMQLKEEFDRIADQAAGMIRRRKLEDGDGDGEASSTTGDTLSALELSLACLHVGMIEKGGQQQGASWGRKFEDNLQSFKVVAACCLLKELDLAIKKTDMLAGISALNGGGYVGVGGVPRR